MRYLLLLFFCQALSFGCKKDTPEEPNPPIVLDTTPTYIPIYLPGDTSMGAAYAHKITANWRAQATCNVLSFSDTNRISLYLATYSSAGYLRESFAFSSIPRFENPNEYQLQHTLDPTPLQNGFITAGYGIFMSDGDVFGDYYLLDTTATDNRFTVEKIDHVNKLIECSFTVSFKIKEPRIQAINPKTVKFSNGRAWAVI